ncbi:MAG: HD-GYP domain-containing protein [Desulfobacterales bacterium]|jgi:PAS domain S-box-containing protein/putative nucleotidyltransferase with HDIG domain|nr:HD-GYP domain-containing protein [Desulfobacterales bacterium]
MEPSFPIKQKKDISSEWLHALVESALDGVITMDDKGRVIAFNPAAEKIFGYHSDQVVGRMVSDILIPKPLRKRHEKGLERFLSTGEKKIIGRRLKVTAMRANQSLFRAEMEVISVNPETTPVFIAYLRDISEQERVEKAHRQYTMNIKKTLLQTILAISRTVEIRDPYTAGHQRRVAHLAASMAQALKLPEARVEGIFLGSLLHDIGKIAVPSEILSRPGKLMDEDINYLKIHCRKGYEILKPVDFPWPVAEIALQHHEHLDGSGYPQGLKDGEILLESRIICIADVVESLTAHRPYRPARSIADALALISNRAGQWYEYRMVAACRGLFESGYRIDSIDIDELTWLSSLGGGSAIEKGGDRYETFSGTFDICHFRNR